MEPFVKILYSESNDAQLQTGSILSLGYANITFEQRDYSCAVGKHIENLVYEVNYMADGEVRKYFCSQNLGDGHGSVINHLRKETLDALECLKLINRSKATNQSKNPFGILWTSCENMLHIVLPELEAYCLAYRIFELVASYHLDNCHSRLQEDLESIISLIKEDTSGFIEMLDEIIIKNPDDTSLIFAVETLIDKTERYKSFVEQKDGEKDNLVDILKDATQRSATINSKSIFYDLEPPPQQVEAEGLYEHL